MYSLPGPARWLAGRERLQTSADSAATQLHWEIDHGSEPPLERLRFRLPQRRLNGDADRSRERHRGEITALVC
jgi:hypothetical protein